MGADPAADEQFGPYLVYERLGVGGMATVHRALERGGDGFERMVALKRLLPHLAEDVSFIKSFVREAKLASILSHLNIVQIYELGRVGAEYFISMEYIDGRDVRRILRHARKVTGPPPIHITVGLMLQLCDALDYAHHKSDEDGQPLGLVHRDVSPSNLLVTSDGYLKIIDFGIAKAQSSQLRTQTGRVKGKLAYMAPEAISGSKDLDARSDLWAAGVILHELLTARPLFASKNEYQTLMKVQRGDIMPPSTFNQGCPPELDAIVFKALSRDPDHRFSHAGEMRDELDRVRAEYQLQSGFREVAEWIDWAFSLEVPAGFSNNSLDSTGVSVIRNTTPRPPRNRDEDEAVEMVWGSGAGEAEGGPILLDDIPDVSGKHLAHQDLDDDALRDDVPTTPPGEGPRLPREPQRGSDRQPAQRTTAQGIVVPERPRDSQPPPRPRDSRPPPVPRPARDSRPSGPAHPHDDAGALTDPDATPVPGTDPADAQGPNDALLGPASDAAATLIGLPRAAVDLAMPWLTESERPPTSALPPMPVVRFSITGQMPIAAAPAAGGDVDARPFPRTKPGVAPVAPPRRTLSTPPQSLPVPRKRPPTGATIGASMVSRNRPIGRRWLVIGGIAIAGGAATGITLFATRGADTVTSVAQPEPRLPTQISGTVKFIIEPADADIRLEGQLSHSGSPWSTELVAGIHQIEIHRVGYKSWLTSIELSAKENQTLRVVLEPIGSAAVAGEATLVVSTTPTGLEAVLDGKLLAQRTPIKVSIKVGPHTIVVRQNGVAVWHQTVNAEASSDYEFNPSVTTDKLRERIERAAVPAPKPRPVAPHAEEAVEPAAVTPPEPKPVPEPEVKPEPAPKPPVLPPPTTPTVIAPAPVAPLAIPTPARSAPALVAPSAVTKLTGGPPDITKLKTVDLPAVIAAKLCIDPTGHVSSVEIINKIDHHVATELDDALKAWQYAPYQVKGVAVAACFIVSLRTR